MPGQAPFAGCPPGWSAVRRGCGPSTSPRPSVDSAVNCHHGKYAGRQADGHAEQLRRDPALAASLVADSDGKGHRGDIARQALSFVPPSTGPIHRPSSSRVSCVAHDSGSSLQKEVLSPPGGSDGGPVSGAVSTVPAELLSGRKIGKSRTQNSATATQLHQQLYELPKCATTFFVAKCLVRRCVLSRSLRPCSAGVCATCQLLDADPLPLRSSQSAARVLIRCPEAKINKLDGSSSLLRVTHHGAVIVRIIPGQGVLADRQALADEYDRSQATIRARCTPVACDVATRRVLYWSREAREILDATPKRRRKLADSDVLIAP